MNPFQPPRGWDAEVARPAEAKKRRSLRRMWKHLPKLIPRLAPGSAELALAVGVLLTISGLILLIGNYDRGFGSIATTLAGVACWVVGFRNVSRKP